MVKECNKESGLNIQIIFDEPKCFDGMMAHYGKFSGVENYIALVGKKDAGLEEKAGYYGEKLVLKAQELGLNTCWVAMTHVVIQCDGHDNEKRAKAYLDEMTGRCIVKSKSAQKGKSGADNGNPAKKR